MKLLRKIKKSLSLRKGGLNTPSLKTSKADAHSTGSITLSKAYRLFEEENMLTQRWRPSTKMNNAVRFNAIVEIIGDCRMDEYTKSDIKRLRKTLLKLPVNRLKHPQFKDKSISELISMEHQNCLNPSTVNHHLALLSSVFNHGIENDYITINPVKGRKVFISKKAKKERDCFPQEALQKIIGGSLFEKGSRRPIYYAWILLIGLFSLARLNEICQLHVDDIKRIDGVMSIHINDSQVNQRLKNQNSRRVIPIHPDLLQLGLLDYVKHVKSRGHQRLFYQLSFDEKNGYGKNASRFFNRYFKECGVKTPRTCFHSIRHSGINFLSQKGIGRDLIHGLVGHSHNSESFDRYAKGYSPRSLLPTVEKLDYGFSQPALIMTVARKMNSF